MKIVNDLLSLSVKLFNKANIGHPKSKKLKLRSHEIEKIFSRKLLAETETEVGLGLSAAYEQYKAAKMSFENK